MNYKQVCNVATLHYKIGIIGIGMVGGALKRYFNKKGKRPFIYDKYLKLGSIEKVNKADIIFICVPTPFKPRKGFDLSIVEDVCKRIKGEKIIIIKSTIIPGTTDNLQKKYPDHKFLFNPEFLTESTADQDMQNPDKQILGYTNKSRIIAKDILKILPRAPYEQIMRSKEAEMIKYFVNTWYCIKVVFANQIYDLCEKAGINYNKVKQGAVFDKRIIDSHFEIFHKGYRGYSGKCLPKDIKAFIQLGNKTGIDLKLHKIVEEINSKLVKKQKL